MTDGTEKLENKIAQDEKRRRRLNREKSSIKPETAEKAEYFADKKRKEYIADNVEETKNVQ
jgi:hypothetical protein